MAWPEARSGAYGAWAAARGALRVGSPGTAQQRRLRPRAGAHPRAGEREQPGGGEREEDPPLDADVRGDAVGGDPGLVEQAQDQQQRHPDAGGEHDRAVAAGELEGAPLAAREQQVEHGHGDEQDGGLDEREDLERVQVAALQRRRARGVDDRVLLVPGQEHRHEQRRRGGAREALLGRQCPPGAAQSCHVPQSRRLGAGSRSGRSGVAQLRPVVGAAASVRLRALRDGDRAARGREVAGEVGRA